MRARSSFMVFVVGLALLLSACSTGPSTPAVPSFDAVVDDPSDTLGLFGVGFLMVDLSVAPLATTEVSAHGLTTAELVEVDTGLWFGEFVAVADGGTATLALPAEADIPAGTMEPVENAFHNATSATDCEVQAAPATAEVTGVVFQGYSFPGFFAVGFDGIEPSIVSEAPVNLGTFPEDGDTVLGWAYADADVEIDFVGTDCGGFVVDGVSLAEGWNALAWTFGGGGTTVTLDVVDMPDTVHVTAASP